MTNDEKRGFQKFYIKGAFAAHTQRSLAFLQCD